MKEAIKILVSSMLVSLISIVILVFVMWLFPNDLGMLLGFGFAYSFFVLVIYFVYPIIFKDYIKEFWKKQEEKNEIE